MALKIDDEMLLLCFVFRRSLMRNSALHERNFDIGRS